MQTSSSFSTLISLLLPENCSELNLWQLGRSDQKSDSDSCMKLIALYLFLPRWNLSTSAENEQQYLCIQAGLSYQNYLFGTVRQAATQT